MGESKRKQLKAQEMLMLENWRPDFDARRSARVAGLLPSPDVSGIKNDPRYRAGIEAAEQLA
jgi:hypothetical protein